MLQSDIDNHNKIFLLSQKVNDLQKESVELKEKLGDVQMQKAGEKSDLVWNLKTANEQKAEQLTEAKEIIRELLGCLQQDTNDPETNYYVVKYIEKAEAFLNSEVGK